MGGRGDKPGVPAAAARLRYGDGAFDVLIPGSHVVCAVTGAQIALEDLKYWDVALQEPYASAEIGLERSEAHRRTAR
jgi:hypothetical protein